VFLFVSRLGSGQILPDCVKRNLHFCQVTIARGEQKAKIKMKQKGRQKANNAGSPHARKQGTDPFPPGTHPVPAGESFVCRNAGSRSNLEAERQVEAEALAGIRTRICRIHRGLTSLLRPVKLEQEAYGE
jgi:hypothetical protein